MILYAFYAFLSGVLIALSRQVNGRLALSTSPVESSLWNHIVGFGALTVIAITFGGLWPSEHPLDAPLYAYSGGAVGVVFIAASSWLVANVGAARTAILVIAGQMISSVLLDLVIGAPGNPWGRIIGVSLILIGIFYGRTQKN